MNAIVIFVTCANKKEARRISLKLLSNKLAACVNILGQVESFFWWEDKVDRANEVFLMIKSQKTKLPKIIELVKSMHSYQVPEIIALPVTDGYKPYLRWINESVR
ncbi:MAG: divalent-cation tolerance protein CutA [Candidatus Omnitrophota bacterium]